MSDFDIDIDVKNSTIKKDKYGIRAITVKDGKLIPHPSGYYIDSLFPIDSLTGKSPMDYNKAEELGFSKIDLLTNSVYEMFDSKEELLEYIKYEPDWELLKDRVVCEKLPHLKDYHDIVVDLNPQSVIEVADILALIRPGKIHLYDEYKKNKEKTRKNLYRASTRGMYFKKSHAVSYAMVIKAALNKINDKSDELFSVNGPRF